MTNNSSILFSFDGGNVDSPEIHTSSTISEKGDIVVIGSSHGSLVLLNNGP